MTTEIGGPAFPCHPGIENSIYDGMTLRDYFAAKAMQIYMADQELVDLYCYLEKDVKQEVACTAYMMADAMLKARTA